MSDLTLYSYYRSSCSYRVRIALHLKNIPFQYRAVHLIKNKGEQFTEDFKKKNPFSQLPCLTHKNHVLTQSLAILMYLEDIYNQPALLPKDVFLRASILSFCEMINSGIQPLQNLSVLKHLKTKHNVLAKDWAKHWIQQGLEHCEQFLKSRAGSFCFGDTISMADCFLIPQLYNAKRFDIDICQFSSLNRVFMSSSHNPAFCKALPENQIDAPKI